MSLSAALECLYRRRTFGVKLGLDVERALLAALGNPNSGVPAVHVAGTNGKGSVSVMLDAVLREAALRTGLYTSPHLVHFNERICVDGEGIEDERLASLITQVESAADRVHLSTGQDATFFEMATAMAFVEFKQRAVDVGILEVGLGGRLDATNVVDPVLSIITSVGLDHTAYLGDDIATIAREKAGIIKPGRPVVCGRMTEDARAVIEAHAKAVGAPIVFVEDSVSVQVKKRSLEGQTIVVESGRDSYGSVKLPLHGDHQVQNLAVCLAACECLADLGMLSFSPELFRRALPGVCWPGRFQVLSREPVVILDGAHNVDSAKALAATLRTLRGGSRVGIVCGVCGDKDVGGMLRELVDVADSAWMVPIANERGMSTDGLLLAAGCLRHAAAAASLEEGMKAALAWAGAENGLVCVTGSLFLVGEVLARRQSLGLGAS